MAIQLGQITALVNGRLAGDAEETCTGANPPGEANAGEITMLDKPSHIDLVDGSDAMAVVTSTELELGTKHQIIVANPHEAFSKIVAMFRPPIEVCVPVAGIDPSAMIHPTASVHPTATIGAEACIGARTQIMPGVVVGPKCQIGADCLLHANVNLYEYSQIADRVTIHSGTVIGAHGFGYRQEEGRHVPTAQLGYVDIGCDVEIGANVTIDRGTYGATRIGEGTKIDNLVMIAHNCQIGKHNLLCSQVGIAGSCRTGDYVVMAGQAGLKDHIHLGDGTIVGAQAGVMDDCTGNDVYLGSPATTQRDQMQIMAVQRRLPEMRRELKKLRRELDEIRLSNVDEDKRAA